MDHKNPVSGIGDGVLLLDILLKHVLCFDCRIWQKVFMSYIEQHPEVLQSQEQPTQLEEPTAPSPVFDRLFERTPRGLEKKEINDIIDAYAEGISRVQEAGFDGVQLHAAHGYLLSSFISPHTNKRDDQYGGSTENRTRIIAEIYDRARKKVGENFPIIIKFNTMDFLPDLIFKPF